MAEGKNDKIVQENLPGLSYQSSGTKTKAISLEINVKASQFTLTKFFY